MMIWCLFDCFGVVSAERFGLLDFVDRALIHRSITGRLKARADGMGHPRVERVFNGFVQDLISNSASFLSDGQDSEVEVGQNIVRVSLMLDMDLNSAPFIYIIVDENIDYLSVAS